ncbi:MAG: exonuclease domain-containing protein [Lewinellaceae bacterium]|nr:exonuclease domain-containing protein [Saprospiraceae bacterium]MCB9330421.1 exonuclease domain-containing protein [Lewinellaceae bacterium]
MRNYIIYDLEATCWENNPEGYVQETIEIGAFRLNHFGEVRGKFNRFVRPVLHPTLSPFCRQLTSISQIDINRAGTFPEVIHEFWDWARIDEEDYVLCSWGSFDKKMFVNDCKLHELDGSWADSHANLKAEYMAIKRLRRPVGLRKAVEREDILFTGVHHRGISDAENLTKLFIKYLGQWSV